jgi:hypothetical protein
MDLSPLYHQKKARLHRNAEYTINVTGSEDIHLKTLDYAKSHVVRMKTVAGFQKILSAHW